jgi:PDDEXK-like domain of unknown function (DUF3799)
MEPGIYYDLPIDVYHADETTVSKSGLDDVARAPAIYRALHDERRRVPPPVPTPQMFIGTLGHCATLEPDAFLKRYMVGPSVHRATKEWKQFVERAAAERCEPIQVEQYDAAMGMAESVRRLPEVRDALATGNPEVSACWRDATTGALCRCRPDWVHPVGNEGVILVDLKTTTDASPEAFARTVTHWRYHVQDAFYEDGFAAASGLEVLGFIFAVVEREYPYAASACMLVDEDVEAGRRTYRRNLATYAECHRTGIWPGYGDGIHLITLPPWAEGKR